MMAFTVKWYGRQGIVETATFALERAAKDHATTMFEARRRDFGVVAVEVRKEDGAVVFSHAGRS
jgi:hypothetical protein